MPSLVSKLQTRLRRLRMSPEERRHALVGPPRMWKMKREFQIRFLRDHGLEPRHFLLDVGCGTLRGGIPIIDYLDTGHYYGLESRPEVLAEGRKELAEAGLTRKRPRLRLNAELAGEPLDRSFDVVWAYSVLFHMHDETLEEMLALIAAHLADGGVLYANVNLGERGEGDWQGFPVVARPLDFYVAACRRHGLAPKDIGALADLGHVSGSEVQDRQRMLRITGV